MNDKNTKECWECIFVNEEASMLSDFTGCHFFLKSREEKIDFKLPFWVNTFLEQIVKMNSAESCPAYQEGK